MSLSKKVVLVSGANKGIGAAIVRRLLQTDVAKIYAAARNPGSLPDFGDARVVSLQLDVTNAGSVRKAAESAGDVDLLVNNAGTMALGDWVTSTDDMIDTDMNTNFYGTLRVIKAFLPAFTSRGSGTIANVVSIVGLAATAPISGYSASKAALQSLTQSLRMTLTPKGISVVGIYPGPVDTDLAAGIPLAKVTPEQVAENIVLGLEKGDTYIFPDPMAQQIGHLFATDGHQLEAAMNLGG